MAKSKSKPASKTKAKKSSGKSKKSLAGRLLRFITYSLLFLLVLCGLSRYISPETSSIPAFLGLLFPYLYVLCFIVALLWLFTWRRPALYAFATLALLLPFMLKFVSIGFLNSGKPWNDEDAFSVMSFNVRAFNRYNQLKDENPHYRRNLILTFIKDEAPDVICLQESYFDTTHGYKTVDTLKFMQQARFVHENNSLKRDKHRFGIATLSRFPIISKGTLFVSDNFNFAIYSDIVKESDTIRVYNAHLSSIGLSREDFAFIENVGGIDYENNDTLPFKTGLRKIAGRLKRAFVKRAAQVEVVAAHIAESPYPSILCTDLNDTPSSYAYRLISKNMQDAFLKSGSGLGKTYNGILPYFRIDYIFYSKEFESKDFETHYLDLSDHYPITVLLNMNKGKAE